jgi:hypothetical protein
MFSANEKGFPAKNVYPSEVGIHIECYGEEDALSAYFDCKSKGMNVEFDGTTVIWKFHNPKETISTSICPTVFDEESTGG